MIREALLISEQHKPMHVYTEVSPVGSVIVYSFLVPGNCTWDYSPILTRAYSNRMHCHMLFQKLKHWPRCTNSKAGAFRVAPVEQRDQVNPCEGNVAVMEVVSGSGQREQMEQKSPYPKETSSSQESFIRHGKAPSGAGLPAPLHHHQETWEGLGSKCFIVLLRLPCSSQTVSLGPTSGVWFNFCCFVKQWA